MSDGTSYLRFLDPKSFRETGRIQATDEAGQAIDNLNELEFIHGEIYANIWHSDMIVRISPRTGKVLGRIDLSGIINKRDGRMTAHAQRHCLRCCRGPALRYREALAKSI